MQSYRAVTDGNAMLDATVFSKGFFKCCDIAPGRGNPAGTDGIGNIFQFITGEHGLADREEVIHESLLRMDDWL